MPSRHLPTGLLIAFLLGQRFLIGAEPTLLEEHFQETTGNGRWQMEGRGSHVIRDGILALTSVEAVAGNATWTDYELKFRARGPKSADQAQIWASVRRSARDSRYVIGLRGGDLQQAYAARYAPDGRQRFLKVQPLATPLLPGTWYEIRIQVVGSTLRVLLDDSEVLRVTDDQEGGLPAGGIALGGGFLPTEYDDITVTRLDPATIPDAPTVSTFSFVGEDIRKERRAAWKPQTIELHNASRTEISLDGTWLFLPEQQVPKNMNGADPGLDDSTWHPLAVPSFWSPVGNWLYDETQGGSDHYVELERQRLAQQTFDGRKNLSGWYRQALILPDVLPVGRRYELAFDAIAKYGEIWVNGKRVHTSIGMFTPSRIDITSVILPGRNLIAARVGIAPPSTREIVDGDKVTATMVSVQVTQAMIHSLPQGIYTGKPVGIWQPVHLSVHDPVEIRDLFFRPRLNGAAIDLELANATTNATTVQPVISVVERATGRALPITAPLAPITIPTGSTTATIDTGVIAPRLWTPDEPNLYILRINLVRDGRAIDERVLDVGFRTFETRPDGRFYLNGKPYWLRGGNATPMPNRPQDPALADRFTALMHEHGTRVTRTHSSAFNELWLNASDRNGVGISYEGTWPWLMLKGKIPPEELVAAWRNEQLALVRKYRNHPSILYWTVNNECYYVDNKDPQVFADCMTQLSDTIKGMRKLDPTRPICPDSGGTSGMMPPFWPQMQKERGFDYGDIDDHHNYTGWYGRSFFAFYPGEQVQDHHDGQMMDDFAAHWGTKGRPLISQEMATGYPNADDGHAVRKYILDLLVPQTWVGDLAYEHQDPAWFLHSVAIATQELNETLRCYHHEHLQGVLAFSLNTWYQNIFEAGRVRPFQPATALAQAQQPVLVTARLFSRHWFAGTTRETNLFVVNDSEQGRDLPSGEIRWRIEAGNEVLASGSATTPAVPYYGVAKVVAPIAIPARLPAARTDAHLVVELRHGQAITSSNRYELVLAQPEWTVAKPTSAITLLDPGSQVSLCGTVRTTDFRTIRSTKELAESTRAIVIGEDWAADEGNRADFLAFIAAGGRALLIKPGAGLPMLFPALVRKYRAKDLEVATMRIPEHPIFDGIDFLDLRWFNLGDHVAPWAVRGNWLLNPGTTAEILARASTPHAYPQKKDMPDIEGAVILRIPYGKGEIIASQLAHEAGATDPIAGRLWKNLEEWVGRAP
jgi:beta-galactosidase